LKEIPISKRNLILAIILAVVIAIGILMIETGHFMRSKVQQHQPMKRIWYPL